MPGRRRRRKSARPRLPRLGRATSTRTSLPELKCPLPLHHKVHGPDYLEPPESVDGLFASMHSVLEL